MHDQTLTEDSARDLRGLRVFISYPRGGRPVRTG